MSKRKGSRIEREIVHAHQEAGIPAERVPLSGGAGGSYTGDVVVADRYRAEVKARKDGKGFALLQRWLGDNDLLFLRQDRSESLVVMPWARYLTLVQAALQEDGHGDPL